MVVQRVGPREVVSQNSFDPMNVSQPPVDKVVRIEPDEYRFDSIQQADDARNSWEKMFPEVAGSLFPHQTHISETRPVLEPSQLDPTKLSAIDKELQQAIPLIGKKESPENQDRNLTEVQLLLLFIACSKMQREQNETNMELTLDIIGRKQQTNKAVTKEFFAKQDELISQNKQSTKIRWINWIFGGALAVVGAGSIALTVATGGAGLPLAITTTLALLNATLALGTGSSKIFQGVLDHKSKKLIGQIEEKKLERMLNTQKIRDGMNEMRESAESVAETWKQVSQLVSVLQQTSVSMSR